MHTYTLVRARNIITTRIYLLATTYDCFDSRTLHFLFNWAMTKIYRSIRKNRKVQRWGRRKVRMTNKKRNISIIHNGSASTRRFLANADPLGGWEAHNQQRNHAPPTFRERVGISFAAVRQSLLYLALRLRWGPQPKKLSNRIFLAYS